MQSLAGSSARFAPLLRSGFGVVQDQRLIAIGIMEFPAIGLYILSVRSTPIHELMRFEDLRTYRPYFAPMASAEESSVYICHYTHTDVYIYIFVYIYIYIYINIGLHILQYLFSTEVHGLKCQDKALWTPGRPCCLCSPSQVWPCCLFGTTTPGALKFESDDADDASNTESTWLMAAGAGFLVFQNYPGSKQGANSGIDQ